MRVRASGGRKHSKWVSIAAGVLLGCLSSVAPDATAAPTPGATEAPGATRPPTAVEPVESKDGKDAKEARPAKAKPAKSVVRAPVEKWRLIESESGPVNYYSLMRDSDRAFIRGAYQPPHKKAVFGFEMPDSSKDRVKRLDWSWRAIKMPHQADECSPKKGDSPAVLYVTWKRMLKWYSLKYVWSASRPAGTVCDRRRNPFVAQDTIVLRSGGPLGVWQHESIDLAHEFRKYFEGGDPKADIPSLIGIAVMTDGDQTKTESTGDYADFVFTL